jgi:hypothetical protein
VKWPFSPPSLSRPGRHLVWRRKPHGMNKTQQADINWFLPTGLRQPSQPTLIHRGGVRSTFGGGRRVRRDIGLTM